MISKIQMMVMPAVQKLTSSVLLVPMESFASAKESKTFASAKESKATFVLLRMLRRDVMITRIEVAVVVAGELLRLPFRSLGVVMDCVVTNSVSMPLLVIEIAVISAVVTMLAGIDLRLFMVSVLMVFVCMASALDVATFKDVALVLVFSAIVKWFMMLAVVVMGLKDVVGVVEVVVVVVFKAFVALIFVSVVHASPSAEIRANGVRIRHPFATEQHIEFCGQLITAIQARCTASIFVQSYLNSAVCYYLPAMAIACGRVAMRTIINEKHILGKYASGH